MGRNLSKGKAVKSVDRHVKLSLETAKRLDDYLEKTYGSFHKPLSAVTEEAIIEFLNKRGV